LTRRFESGTLPTDVPMCDADNIMFPVGVAFVLPGLGRGGTEKHVLELASRIDRRRFSPCVISTAEDGTMEEEFTGRGIPVYRLPYRGLSFRPTKFLPLLREARAFFRGFARILAESRVAVLHAYLPAANVLGMAGALRCRTRVRIVGKRALCRYKEGHPTYSLFEDFANLAADAVMVNSRAVAEDVRRNERFFEGKMFLVHNGLEVPPETSGARPPLPPDIDVPPDALLVTYVANLREDKGHLRLVEAARLVVGVVPEARFLFVGREDREAAPVRARIRELGLGHHVVLTGSRRDVPGILRASRLVAHPGEQEGLSNAILEAMAAGIPVVASRAGGNPEAVEDGETGLLVPEGDPGALASGILALLCDPSRADAMGRAARKRAMERFSLEGMVAAVEETYLELLEGRPLSRRI
jgi:glycosyltransferase involved in cell wall biosynthesis